MLELKLVVQHLSQFWPQVQVTPMRPVWIQASYLIAVCIAMLGWLWFAGWVALRFYQTF